MKAWGNEETSNIKQTLWRKNVKDLVTNAKEMMLDQI